MSSFRLISYDGLVDIPYDKVVLEIIKENGSENSFVIIAESLHTEKSYKLARFGSEREAVNTLKRVHIANSTEGKMFYEFYS